MRSRFGQGADWPLTYEELEPFYHEAEREIGVSADVEDQAYLGITFARRTTCSRCAGCRCRTSTRWSPGPRRDAGRARRRALELQVRAVPAGPQRDPEPGLRRRARATCRSGPSAPTRSRRASAARATTTASRICPVQAKYNAGKTLAKAAPERASRPAGPDGGLQGARRRDSGRVTEIEYSRYDRPDLAGVTPRERPRADVRAGRQRDRERPADAGLRPASRAG